MSLLTSCQHTFTDLEQNIEEVIEKKQRKVFYQNTAPTVDDDLQEGDIWYETKKGKGGMYHWDGTKWVVHQIGTTSIQNGAITTDLIDSEAVTAAEIQSGTITSKEINTDELFATNISATNMHLSGDSTVEGKVTATSFVAYDTIGLYQSNSKGSLDVIKYVDSGSDSDTKSYSIQLGVKTGSGLSHNVGGSGSSGTQVVYKMNSFEIMPHSNFNGSVMFHEPVSLYSASEFSGNTTFYSAVNLQSDVMRNGFDVASLYVHDSTKKDPGIWHVERYSDGYLRLTGRIPINNLAVSTQLGSWYRSSEAFKPSWYNYCYGFTEDPIVHIQFYSTNNNCALFWPADKTGQVMPPTGYLIRPSSATVSGYLHITAEGKGNFTS